MKLSKYNLLVEHNDNLILFNTISKKYIKYHLSRKNYIEKVLHNLNKDKYTLDEVEIIKKIWRKGIIVPYNLEEFEIVLLNEQKLKFQNDILYLVIQPTLDCNFKCTYCYEDHNKTYINNDTYSNIIKFINNISKHTKKLYITWFGGEPLLAIDLINKLSKEIILICKKNNCSYNSTIVTNGYLLTNKNIELLKSNNISTVQITIDGPKESHDKKRPLKNGNGTFDIIFKNLSNLLNHNINIILRINIDKDNINNIEQIFDTIEFSYRKHIYVNLCNLFQTKEKINLYSLYLKALEKGYNIDPFPNSTYRCDAYANNSLLIQPTGNIAPCSILAEKGLYFGHLDTSGNIKITNHNLYYKFKNYISTNIESCKKCIEEPICGGPCIYQNLYNNIECDKSCTLGLSLSDRIKLLYEKDSILGIKEDV